MGPKAGTVSPAAGTTSGPSRSLAHGAQWRGVASKEAFCVSLASVWYFDFHSS